jgi:hypothetical protein
VNASLLRPVAVRILLWALLIGLLLWLSGCQDDRIASTEQAIQQNYFLQSLSLVESAGQLLMRPGLTQEDIDRAMQRMDLGLEQARKVEDGFLKKLEPRLAREYREKFIQGVEEYRLGVEASDRERQLQGLGRLGQWGDYWKSIKPGVLRKLETMNLPQP